MLVYANHLAMHGRAAKELTFQAVGGWLKEQLGYGLTPTKLRRRGEFNGNRGDAQSWLRIYGTSEEIPELYAWTLKVTDPKVSGRQWISELGVCVSDDIVEMSCVIRTDEVSTLVVQPASASQPRVIRYLMDNVKESGKAHFAPSVPGIKLKTVGKDKNTYRALAADVEHESRNYSIVLISPDTDGRYLVDPGGLQKKVFGLAQVVRVSPEYNSYDMEDILGQRWSAWDGAVNVIQTRARTGFIRGRVLRSPEIEEMGPSQADRVAHILANVTAQTNVPRLRKRIRPESVAQLSLRRHMQELHARATKMGTAAFLEQLEKLTAEVQKGDELITDLDSYSNDLETEKELLSSELEEAREALRTKEYENQGLKHRLDHAGERRDKEEDLDYLLQLVCQDAEPSVVDCLRLIETVYGDRCVILESARESASKMNRFSRGRYLLDRLIRLVTVYKGELVRGGDAWAKHVFGPSEFAATESETITSNKTMVRARTFEYNGQQVPMFRHLKIGVADDQSKTIRVHFHWDSDREKIVIGYCGPHLPISSR